mmetsp:Transcript_8393/g.23595  ORF Transcript_8393/g.23595 Transcript_8393/m.23595 type:complete len:192 (-) Transcript_8393:18-593(-)
MQRELSENDDYLMEIVADLERARMHCGDLEGRLVDSTKRWERKLAGLTAAHRALADHSALSQAVLEPAYVFNTDLDLGAASARVSKGGLEVHVHEVPDEIGASSAPTDVVYSSSQSQMHGSGSLLPGQAFVIVAESAPLQTTAYAMSVTALVTHTSTKAKARDVPRRKSGETSDGSGFSFPRPCPAIIPVP